MDAPSPSVAWGPAHGQPLFSPQFFTCLVILFACEVAAGIWGFVNKDQVSCRGRSSPWVLGCSWTPGACLVVSSQGVYAGGGHQV